MKIHSDRRLLTKLIHWLQTRSFRGFGILDWHNSFSDYMQTQPSTLEQTFLLNIWVPRWTWHFPKEASRSGNSFLILWLSPQKGNSTHSQIVHWSWYWFHHISAKETSVENIRKWLHQNGCKYWNWPMSWFLTVNREVRSDAHLQRLIVLRELIHLLFSQAACLVYLTLINIPASGRGMRFPFQSKLSLKLVLKADQVPFQCKHNWIPGVQVGVQIERSQANFAEWCLNNGAVSVRFWTAQFILLRFSNSFFLKLR